MGFRIRAAGRNQLSRLIEAISVDSLEGMGIACHTIVVIENVPLAAHSITVHTILIEHEGLTALTPSLHGPVVRRHADRHGSWNHMCIRCCCHMVLELVDLGWHLVSRFLCLSHSHDVCITLLFSEHIRIRLNIDVIKHIKFVHSSTRRGTLA